MTPHPWGGDAAMLSVCQWPSQSCLWVLLMAAHASAVRGARGGACETGSWMQASDHSQVLQPNHYTNQYHEGHQLLRQPWSRSCLYHHLRMTAHKSAQASTSK
eukprot:1153824-Amphidinium_carterae.1